MKGLLIKDEIRWHDHWSAELGKQLKTMDSSNNLIIFDEKYGKEEILAIIGEAPEGSYQIMDLEQATEEDCDFMADSGLCYRRLH
jgi:hypothetical protein